MILFLYPFNGDNFTLDFTVHSGGQRSSPLTTLHSLSRGTVSFVRQRRLSNAGCRSVSDRDWNAAAHGTETQNLFPISEFHIAHTLPAPPSQCRRKCASTYDDVK